MPAWAAGRHRPWALHGQFYLCPLLWYLGLQAQLQVIVHGSWNRGHQELQCLAFPQPNKAWACPGRSSLGTCQTLHHIKHLASGVLSLKCQVVKEGPEVARLDLITASPHHVLAAVALTRGFVTLGIQGTAHVAITWAAAKQVVAQAPVARQAAVAAMSGH